MFLSARAFVFFVLIGARFVTAVSAATSVCHDGFSIRGWSTEDGLPQNTVTAITQTQDGFIWIGTLGGLARFDGERFQVFDTANTPGLGENRVSCFYEDAGGTLWIGHDSGAITCYRAGRFEPAPDGAHASERIHAICADADGAIWLLRQDGAFLPLRQADASAMSGSSTPENLLAVVGGGVDDIAVLVNGIVAHPRGGRLEAIEFGPARLTGFALGMGAAADGGLWVARDGRLRKWRKGYWREDRGPYPWPECSLTSIVERRDGVVAIGTLQKGLYLIWPNGRSLNFDHSNGLNQNWVRALFEDREGNLWLGAGSGGLVSLRTTSFDVLNPPDGWEGRTVLSVAPAPDGALWIGTEGAGLYAFRDGQWSHFGSDRGIQNPFVWSVAAGPAGQIWAGSWSGGIYKSAGESFVEATELGSISGPVLALQFAPDDDALWVGAGRGFLRWRHGKAKRWENSDEGPPVQVRGMARDVEGVMWFALSAGGLGRLAGGDYTRLGKADGLSSDSVQCLLADGDALWIGTSDAGLNRLKEGRVVVLGSEQGVPSPVICHVAADDRGYLWMSTHHGLWRVAREELNRCADGDIASVSGQVYGKSDGLPTLEYSGGMQAAGCRTTDGRLWFPSGKGLVSVDPAAIQINPWKPPVVIESLRVDGRLITPEALSAGSFRLPPAHHRLEFQYTALCLTASSKVRFNYRLIGLDHDWIDADTKRTASYSQLAPGTYQFQVIAANNDGIWNEQGVMLTFSVLPFYWQTWWFRGFVSLLILTAVAVSVRTHTRRRMQRRVEELEYETGIARERARIAQDIHDDIGSSLTSIMMLSQSLRSELDQPQRTATVLERIHGTALTVTHALDEIVWAVNPRHDTLESLVSYMAKYSQDTLASAGIRCRFVLPVDLPSCPLNSHVRHHLILAFKEALNNVIKHAGASEVTISLTLRPETFVITVEDDGKGFSPPASEGTPVNHGVHGNGLSNLRRRLSQIEGKFEIATQPGHGTRVSFVVALGRA